MAKSYLCTLKELFSLDVDESEKVCGECMYCYQGMETGNLYCCSDGSKVEENDKCHFNPSEWHQNQMPW